MYLLNLLNKRNFIVITWCNNDVDDDCLTLYFIIGKTRKKNVLINFIHNVEILYIDEYEIKY